MGILKDICQYDELVKDLNGIEPGEEKTVIIGDRAYVVRLAEVADIERVPVGGRIYGD